MNGRVKPPALTDLSHRIVSRHPDPQRGGYVATVDDQGVARSGPAGSWWCELTPRRRGECGIAFEIPARRMRAWNVAAVVYAVAAVFLAYRLGVLVPFLVILGAVVLAGAVGIVAIQRRIDRNAAGRLAAYRATRAGVPAAVAPEPSGVCPVPVSEGVS